MKTYTGCYVGPYRKKNVPTHSAEADVVTKSTNEIDFDQIFSKLQAYIINWGKEKDIEINFEKVEHKLYSAWIDENVKAHIKNSDFIIADISGDNKNALLELGYAEGTGKSYVIISQGGINIHLPSDKSGRLIAPYDPHDLNSLFKNIGIQMDYIVDEVNKKRNMSPYPVSCYSKRDIQVIDKEIDNAKNCIHILQTNLETLDTNHISHIKSRMIENDQLVLRLLTLDPQSTYVNERAKQLGRTGDEIGVYRSGLITSIDQSKIELKELITRTKIKIYDDFPTQMTYRIDNKIMICTVSQITKSRENCSFIIDDINKPGISQSFLKHFKEIWKSSSTREVFGELQDDDWLER